MSLSDHDQYIESLLNTVDGASVEEISVLNTRRMRGTERRLLQGGVVAEVGPSLVEQADFLQKLREKRARQAR